MQGDNAEGYVTSYERSMEHHFGDFDLSKILQSSSGLVEVPTMTKPFDDFERQLDIIVVNDPDGIPLSRVCSQSKAIGPARFGELFTNAMRDKPTRGKLLKFFRSRTTQKNALKFTFFIVSQGDCSRSEVATFDFDTCELTRTRRASGFLNHSEMVIVWKGYTPHQGMSLLQ